MAIFEEAFKITNANEGGYSNNPSDSGGETYAGISRNNWPKWSGWSIIDFYKPLKHGQLLNIPALNSDVENFYKQNFWNPLLLDQINDQQIANAIYDFGVNAGVVKSAKTIQKVLGTLTVNGVIGPKAIAAINGANQQNVYNTFNIARGEFYHSLAQKPGQHQFLASWLSRIKPYIS